MKNETDDHKIIMRKMTNLERHWRTYMGIIYLKGYAKWRAGTIVLNNIIATLLAVIMGSYLYASVAFAPISFLLGIKYPTSLIPSHGSDIAFHAIAAACFLWTMPGQALILYHGLREELEKFAREEGTFWRPEFWSD